MNNLKLSVTIPSLSLLTPVATDTYMVAVKFLDSSGSPLSSPYIPNTYVDTVVTTSTSFDVNVPISDATFFYDDVIIKTYADSTSNCCFAQGTFDINNTESGGGEGIMARLADFGYFDHLDWEWEGESGNWTGRDLSTVTAPPGYKIRYYIGDEILIRDTPMDSYLWASDNIFHVEKCLIKDGVDDLYFWGTAEPSLVRPNDGSPMSGNTSVAYQTWIFN